VENNLKVLLLMGLPGSGKSTLCEKLPQFKRINQDQLGNRNDCINAMKRSLSQGTPVVIDRTNISRSQRRYFLDVAKDHGAKVFCIFLDVPAVECIERVRNRKVHETLPASSEKRPEISAKFNTTLELPEYSEGYEEIIHITNISELNDIPGFFKRRDEKPN
jgi:predicted kinase